MFSWLKKFLSSPPLALANKSTVQVEMADVSTVCKSRGDKYFDEGMLEEAAKSYQQAISINPNFAEAYNNLGNVLREQGLSEEAEHCLKQAILIKPALANAYYNLGSILYEQGRLNEAAEKFNKVLTIKSDLPEAHIYLGNLFWKQSRLNEALASFDQALAIQPNNVEALSKRGSTLHELMRHEEALESYDTALAIQPDHVETLANRGNTLHELKQHAEALESYDQAIAIQPDHLEALSSRGNALFKLKRHDEALASYDMALAIQPNHVSALSNRGNALHELKRHEEALASYEKLIAIHPDNVDALSNRGCVLNELKRHTEALASYEKALAIMPDHANAHFNESLCRLLTGDLKTGWQKFEWRWNTAHLKTSKRNFSQPLWLGKQPLLGKSILLHSEQGLGDTIQFARFVQKVAMLGATVLLEIPPPLKSLLKNMDGISQLICKGEPLPPFDYHCPLLSLPLAFNSELHTIPSKIPYLASVPKLFEEWQARLKDIPHPRVGIVWRGNPAHMNDEHRSIPLQKLISLTSHNFSLISLQKEIREEDQYLLDAHKEILYFKSELKDFGDTAALIDSLDLIISIDTSVAHLVGAMGKPIWILLPFIPDWRWLLDREDSPWYPTARLFRQPAVGDWDSVIQRITWEVSKL